MADIESDFAQALRGDLGAGVRLDPKHQGKVGGPELPPKPDNYPEAKVTCAFPKECNAICRYIQTSFFLNHHPMVRVASYPQTSNTPYLINLEFNQFESFIYHHTPWCEWRLLES